MKAILKLGAIILAIVATTPCFSQSSKGLDILIEAYEGSKNVKDVNFRLVKGDSELVNETSKRGEFNFIIEEGDPKFQLVISKEGYLTKRILFNPSLYPFQVDYETQEIGIKCVPINAQLKDFEFVGQMNYDNIGRTYSVNKIDSTSINLKKELALKNEQIENMYQKAIYNGEGLIKIEEYDYAKGYFELALVAKPNDSYAAQKIQFADSMSIIETSAPLIVSENQSHVSDSSFASIEESTVNTDTAQATTPDKSIETPKPIVVKKLDDGNYYSVQLGAFVDWYNESAFENVNDLLVVQGSDYKRCLAGQFENRQSAIDRAKELKELGFKDAFVVQMKGNQRIGF